MSDTPSGKLKEQDLTNLDVTKLTPSSSEVISRQATNNIGTIGHVAHGKSTIVKAVSGVQTVRFKNKLKRKRNITINLDEKQKSRDTSTTSPTNKVRSSSKKIKLKSDCNASRIKIYRCNDDGLDNIDAALSCDKKCTSEYDESSVDSKDFTLVNSTFSLLLKENPEFEVDASPNNGQNNCEMSKKDKNLESTDLCSNSISSSDYSLDTAYITVVFSLRENFNTALNYISYNDKIKSFILKGEMIELKDSIDGYDISEIDEIINDVIVYGIHFYLIKWKNWSRGFKTWERFGSLSKSQKLFFEYMTKKKRNDDGREPINGISLILSRKIISNLFQIFRNMNGLSLPLILPEDLSKILNYLDLGPSKTQMQRKKCLKSMLSSILLDSHRKTQLQDLNKWEVDINLLEKKNKIKVENNLDLEGPPDFFVYTSNYIPRNSIVIPNNPLISCNCKKNCQNSNDCCNRILGCSAVYDGCKNIAVPSEYHIYECNDKCKCSAQCSNRVVQLGSEVQICIYKTTECGWGIKTLQRIEKGQFIAKYVGEIITVTESEQRIENNSSSIDYMWKLDFDDPQNYKYIIDISHYANFTHFINHSCEPNLNVHAVWINCFDRNLPQLALFANRTIYAGEQLTTNYFSRASPKTLKRSGIRCRCNMKNCKAYYFSSERIH